MTASKRLFSRLFATLAIAFCVCALPIHRASAQMAPQHHSWIHRHPTATGFGAAIVTHHLLKVAARNAKLHHKKLNFAERHPSLTAIGAGLAVHHVAKYHTQ